MATLAPTQFPLPVHWMRSAARAVWDCYAAGGRGLIAAPLIAALVVVPEALQHVAELWLGMFDSRSAALALQNSPIRWGFGYVKVAGMVLAMTAFARFYALGSVRAALLPGWRTVAKVAVVIGLTYAVGFALQMLQNALGDHPVAAGVAIINLAVQILLLVPTVAALIEDTSVPLWRTMLRWRSVLAIAALGTFALAPGFLLHVVNHKLALRTPFAVDVALMAFDALVVGLLASLIGAALVRGYRAGYSAATASSARSCAWRFHISA